MSQSTHRFVLEMDAQQAKRVAKEFRQAIEAELGGIGGSTGASPLANVQKSVQEISKTEMFTDATRRAEQLETVMRRIRDLSTQVQNMDIKIEPNTARWNAQVEEFYKKVESAMGKQQADLARGRNVIPNVGAVGAEFSSDTTPVEEWSVKAKRTGEEVKRMGNEYNKLFAELSQAQAERVRLEIEGIEDEIKGVESVISSGEDDGTLLQRLYDLADTKERMVREEAQELAAYQRAMQEYIANDVRSVPQDGPAASSRLTISNQTVANMERLAELLQQAEGFQKSIAASTQAQSQSISAELGERRQLLESEYQGRLRILEAERQTLKATSETKQEELDKKNARKVELNTSKQSLVIEQEKLEIAEKATKEAEAKVEAEKRARAEANRDYAKANTETAKVNAGRDKAITAQKEFDAIRAREQANKQKERNNLEVEKRMTSDAEAEEAERKEAARQGTIDRRVDRNKELIDHREAQKRMTAITREEQRRQTKLYEQELRERNRQVQRSQSQLSGFLRNTAQDLVLGGLGLYGADQVVQRSYDFGKEGAQQLRTMETFANLAKNVGADADDMLDSIQNASSGTISEFDAMSYASQLFAQKFAGEVTNIEGDMEVLIKGARRFSQIYTDEFGKPLGVQEIFSRLLKYVREGNKELVDQFGISNQAIADALNIPNEGLGSAEGTLNRWKGLLLLIEEQMGRLGEATDSTADRFEQSEARISNAINRLRQSSSEPIAFVVEVVADLTEQAVGSTLQGDYAGVVAKQIRDLNELKKEVRQSSEGEFLFKNEDLNNQLATIGQFQNKLNELAKFERDSLFFEVETNTKSITDARTEMQQLGDASSQATEVFGRATELATQGFLNQALYQQVSSEILNIVAKLQNGNISYETAISSLNTIWSTTILVGDELAISTQHGWDLAEALAAGADAFSARQAELGRLEKALEDPSLASLNSIGALGTSMKVETYGERFLRQRQAQAQRTEVRALNTVRQKSADYDYQRMSPSDQYSYLGTQRQSLVESGAPQSEIEELTLSMRMLNDSIMDDVNATYDQVSAIEEQTKYDLMSTQQQLDYRRGQIAQDTGSDLDRAGWVRDIALLEQEVAKTTEEERQKENEERSAAFVETTSERIGNFRTYEERLNYLGSVAMQAQGTPAEEGINTLIQEVLNKQGQLDERRWEDLFDNSNFSVQQQMLLEAITNTNDEYDRELLQERLTDIVEQEDKRIQQEEERAAKDESKLAESKRSADLAALDDADQLNYLKDYLKTLDEGTEEYFDTLKDINSLERRLAEEGAREAQAAWDKAAKDMAKSFEEELAKVMNIPGVLSPSQVTEQDMIDAKYGLYQENADEWLRRAKDELVNGVDRPDVDPGKIAEMLGLPGGLPGEVLYGRLEGAWSNQSLFANKENLGLLNTDAIMSRYMDVKNGEIGRQNLEDYIAQTLQIGVGEASLIAGTQSPLVQQLTGGQSGAEMASQIAAIQKDVMGSLDSSFVDTIASGWQKDIDENISKLDPLADAMADRINARLTDKLGQLTGLVDSVATKVLELLAGEEEA